jgi:hypothetical protein
VKNSQGPKKENDTAKKSAHHRLLLGDTVNRTQTGHHFIAAQADYCALGKQFL